MDIEVPVRTAWSEARVGQQSGDLETIRGFGDLFGACSIKRKAGECFGKCMRLNVGSGCWTRFKTKIQKELLGMDLSVSSVGYAVFKQRPGPVATLERRDSKQSRLLMRPSVYSLCRHEFECLENSLSINFTVFNSRRTKISTEYCTLSTLS